MFRSIIVAPDSFKGSATASAVAAAIVDGWKSVRPHDRMTVLPMADGGEGTMAALAVANPAATRQSVVVTGPDGRPLRSSWLCIPGPDGVTGVVECASTSGLALPRPRNGMDADSRGFGEAIVAALDAGVDRLLLALGGSATSDGGAGALRALGARFSDDEGSDILPGNRGLQHLQRTDLSGLRPLPRYGAIVLSDVRSPLLGPTGAIAMFGPQKDIGHSDAATAEANLALLGAAFDERRPAVTREPGAGAAGGLGCAMLAWGASASSGALAVAEQLGLADALDRADAVITGEGRYDDQSAQGKVVSAVNTLAHERGIPVFLIAGAVEASVAPFAAAAELTEIAGSSAAAIADPERWIREAAAYLAGAADFDIRWPHSN